MTSRIERLLVALVFAFLAAGTTLIIASAQTSVVPTAPQASADCATCHTETEMTWQTGAHGTAGSNPVFLGEWDKQGKPSACLTCHTTGYDPAAGLSKADGVTCESCHSPVPSDHPQNPMPVEPSAELCSRCHSSAGLGAQIAQGNTHYEKGLNCTSCHDPHSTSLKTVPEASDQAKTRLVSGLCVTCHTESNMDYSLTAHAQRGVSCADCHVEGADGTQRLPHTVPDHSFNAKLASCNTCHAQQMHGPGDAAQLTDPEASLPIEQTPKIIATSTTPEPGAVSPIGFSTMAGLIGLAGGMVLAPWLDRWYRRIAKQSHEDQND